MATFHHLGAADGAIHIEDMVKVAELALRETGEALRQRLAERGIAASPPVQLSFDGAGRVVADAHPRQREIQQLLADDPALEQTLRDALVMQEQAVGWQKAERFQQAYAATWQGQGQRAAARLLERFMALGEPRASLRLGPDGLQARFDGKSSEQYLAAVVRSLGPATGLAVDAFA